MKGTRLPSRGSGTFWYLLHTTPSTLSEFALLSRAGLHSHIPHVAKVASRSDWYSQPPCPHPEIQPTGDGKWCFLKSYVVADVYCIVRPTKVVSILNTYTRFLLVIIP